MKNKFLGYTSIIFLLIFIIVISIFSITNERNNIEISQAVSEVKELEVEKANINRKIDALDKEYRSKRSEKASFELLFKGPKKILFNEYFPGMKAKKLKGVILISPDMLPNGKDNMSLSEFNEMLNAGWESALYWNGEGDFETFIKNANNEFFIKKITVPKIIYFKEGSYSKKYNELLIKYKFNTVIHSGEENNPVISSTYTEPLWLLGSKDIFKTNFLLDKTVQKVGNLVLIIDLKYENTYLSFDYFGEFLDRLISLEKSEVYYIGTIKQARKNHGTISDADIKLKQSYDKNRKVLEDRIEEIDKNIYSLIEEAKK